MSPSSLSNQRYNFIVLTLDGLFFWLGISYYSATTILPLFVSHLKPSNLVVGAVPAVVALSWSLPQLFGALAVTDPGMPLALAERSNADRAIYVAVANTVLAPVYVVAPLVGGAAADTGG